MWKSAGGLRFPREPLPKAAGKFRPVLRVRGNIRAAKIFASDGSETFDEGPKGEIERGSMPHIACRMDRQRALRGPRSGFVGFREGGEGRGNRDG